MVDVNEGRRLLAEATEGPWEVRMVERFGFVVLPPDADATGEYPVAEVRDRSDADFMAFWRANAEALLDAVEKVEAVRALVAPIIEENRGRIGTHSADCHGYHAGCLAVVVAHRLGSGVPE